MWKLRAIWCTFISRGDDLHQDGTSGFSSSPRVSAHVTFSLFCRENTYLKRFILKTLFAVYSPGTPCLAFGKARASEQNVRSFSASGCGHQRCLLQGRVLVWRSQPAKEGKKCSEQTTRDKNPSWALSQWHSFVASAVKLWKVRCFLRSRGPRRALAIKIQSVHPPVQGTRELNSLKAEIPPSRGWQRQKDAKNITVPAETVAGKEAWNDLYLLHSEAQINFTHP